MASFILTLHMQLHTNLMHLHKHILTHVDNTFHKHMHAFYDLQSLHYLINTIQNLICSTSKPKLNNQQRNLDVAYWD
jgi:hypothetical protein